MSIADTTPATVAPEAADAPVPDFADTAAKIRAALGEKNWTQKRLAQETGISAGNLSRYLNGSVSPTMAVVDRIWKAIGQTHVMAAVDGVLGVQGRAPGKLNVVDIMADPDEIEWIASGFVARGFLTMIAGQPGAGKSMLTQTLAEALVAGRDAALDMKLGHRYAWKLCTGHDCLCPDDLAADDAEHYHRRIDSRVLVLDAENAANIIQQRAQDMGLTTGAADRYIAAASDGFDIYKDRAALDAMLADYANAGTPIDLLVIDSFTSMWFGNENVVEQVSGVLKYLNNLAAKYQLGILLIHHTGKDGDDYRGSSAIAATIGGGVFTFTRYDEKDGEDYTARRLLCTKMRIAAEPSPARLYLTSHGVDTEPETSADRIALSVAERGAAGSATA